MMPPVTHVAAPPEHGQNYRWAVADEWTEVVRSDEAVYDADEVPRLVPPLDERGIDAEEARRLLRVHGINVEELDFSTDVRIHGSVRKTGQFVRQFYAVLVRTERLPDAR